MSSLLHASVFFLDVIVLRILFVIKCHILSLISFDLVITYICPNTVK